MEFRSQKNKQAEDIQANINGIWRTVGRVVKSRRGPYTDSNMFHAHWLGVFGVVGTGIGTWASAYKARKQIEQMAINTIKPENITF
jgi:hypothetical protein